MGWALIRCQQDLFRVCGQHTHGKKNLSKNLRRGKGREKKTNGNCTPTTLFGHQIRNWVPWLGSWAECDWLGLNASLMSIWLTNGFPHSHSLQSIDQKKGKIIYNNKWNLTWMVAACSCRECPSSLDLALKYFTHNTCKHAPADMQSCKLQPCCQQTQQLHTQ